MVVSVSVRVWFRPYKSMENEYKSIEVLTKL